MAKGVNDTEGRNCSQCASHVDFVSAQAVTAKEVGLLKEWVSDIDKKMDLHNKNVLDQFATINATLNQWQGGGKTFVKIGAALTGFIGVVVLVWNLILHLLERGAAQ